MPIIQPTKECPFCIEHGPMSDEDMATFEAAHHYRHDYAFNVYPVSTWMSNKPHYDAMTPPGVEDDVTDDIAKANRSAVITAMAGRASWLLTGELYMGMDPRSRAELNALWDTVYSVLWAMVEKVSCRNCGKETAIVSPVSPSIDGDGNLISPDQPTPNDMSHIGPEGAQGDDCSSFYSVTWRHFYGSYGSSKFDMAILEPTCKGVVYFGLSQDNPSVRHGPYCDGCIGKWIDDRLLVEYDYDNPWNEGYSWLNRTGEKTS